MTKTAVWTDEEVAIVMDLTLTVKQKSEKLGRSEDAVAKKRTRLKRKAGDGWVRADGHRNWESWEVDLISDETISANELAAKLNRTVHAVNQKRFKLIEAERKRLGIKRSGSRNWTESELAVLGDRSISHAEVARITGRTYESVINKRRSVDAGRVNKEYAWSQDELDLLVDAWDMGMDDLCKLFADKSRGSIKFQRQQLRNREGMPSQSRHLTNPHWVGSRRLLAKTCLGCGLLMDARWYRHTVNPDTAAAQDCAGARRWDSTCIACKRGKRTDERAQYYRASKETHAAQAKERVQRYQSLTTPAPRNGLEWTSSELEILADPMKTTLTKAIELGRTYLATKAKVAGCGYQSLNGQLGDQQDGVWNIEFPAAEAVLARELATAA